MSSYIKEGELGKEGVHFWGSLSMSDALLIIFHLIIKRTLPKLSQFGR